MYSILFNRRDVLLLEVKNIAFVCKKAVCIWEVSVDGGSTVAFLHAIVNQQIQIQLQLLWFILLCLWFKH